MRKYLLINKNRFIIYITIIALSIQNSSYNYFRPIEVFIPLIIIILIYKSSVIKNDLLIVLLLLFYLLCIYLKNNLNLNGLHNMQYWVYASIFFLLSKILVSIDIHRYKKLIIQVVSLSILFIIVIYILNYLNFKPTMIVFTGLPESDLMIYKVAGRTAGVSIYIILFAILLSYLYKLSWRYNLFLIVSSSILLFLNYGRQFAILLVLFYTVLFLKLRYIIIGAVALILFYSSIISFSAQISNSNNTFLSRTAEMINFYRSPSMVVRLLDSYQVINNLYDEKKIFFGAGTGEKISLLRTASTYDYYSEEISVNSKISTFETHSPDNSFIYFLIDGGLILLSVMILLFLFFFYNTITIDKKLGSIFFLLYLVVGLLSTHLITSYVITFILGFMYFYTQELKNKMEIN